MIHNLLALLRSHRFPLSSETKTQAEISRVLAEAGIAHEREVWLNDKDRIDFVAGDVGIEVKVKGYSKMQIYRQMERYAKCDWLATLVLVTNVPMGMPPEIDGVPVYVVNLAKAWM